MSIRSNSLALNAEHLGSQAMTPSAPGSRAGGVLPPYRGHARLKREGVDAWLDKEKPGGERTRTVLPGQGFDTASLVNLSDWELEIRKAARGIIDV
jgi:hypothetical protein